MAVAEYHTIAAPAEGIYREKMSRFISLAFPVASAAEAKEVIARVANQYHDARHVCWAYMIGAEGKEWLSSDNGEPSGTAGKPILGQIRSAGLTNVVICVVRYFGGIKLGTSGLIVAYREAAREAIAAAQIITAYEMATLTFSFPYLAMNDVMKAVKSPDVKIVAQAFDNLCSMTLTIRADRADALRAKLESCGAQMAD
ncbi:MAG: YigZ family protein [Bacteroidales bacterium]|nr:YigZ family protein [Bacteroidales bacterium]